MSTGTLAASRTEAAGLTAAEVRERVANGLENRRRRGSGRSFGQIVRANVVTPFNVLLGALAVVVVATGSWRDALFGFPSPAGWCVTARVPFSSERKWSAGSFAAGTAPGSSVRPRWCGPMPARTMRWRRARPPLPATEAGRSSSPAPGRRCRR